jgi:C4-dicarboxylate transporter, DctQ subunit
VHSQYLLTTMNSKKPDDKVIKKLIINLNNGLANLATLTIVIITVSAVFMRYVLNNPIQWVEELQMAIYIWAIMLGAASAMKDRKHISIDVFFMLLPTRVQRYAQHMNDVISIVILVVFGWLGLQLALDSGDKITPILQASYLYIDLSVPVGCFLMAVYLIGHLISDVRKHKKDGV